MTMAGDEKRRGGARLRFVQRHHLALRVAKDGLHDGAGKLLRDVSEIEVACHSAAAHANA